MKKVLCLIIASLLVLGSPGFSAESSGADFLKQYAFIQGNEKGDLLLDKVLTRAEACVLLSEIYGVKETAKQFKESTLFKDVEKGQWFYGYVTYAQSKGWVKGYTDGTFKPKDTISAKEWASMLMNALNYTMNWTTVEEDLMTLGVVVQAKDSESIIRSEAFEAMWQAVNIPRNGKEISLGVELGKLPAPPALPEPPQLKPLKVESLREIVVHTSQPLDGRTVLQLRNYSVSTKGLMDLSVQKVQYEKAEGKIYLTLNRPVSQMSDVLLKITGLASEKGEAIENLSFTVNMLDMTAPTIVSAEVIGRKNIKLTFSEPLMSKEEQDGNYNGTGTQHLPMSAFMLNDGSIAIRDIVLQKGNKVAIIETYVDLYGSVKIRPRGEYAKDYFNFRVQDLPLEIAYVIDTTPPTIVGYENATATEVTLIFNEEIRLVNTAVSNYYHTTVGYTVDEMSTEKHLEGNRLKLYFGRNMLSSGDNTVVVAANAITDYTGNRNPQTSIVVKLEKDTVKPTVVKVEPVTESIVRVQFSEPMFNRGGEAQDRSRYKIVDSDGKDVSGLIRSIIYRLENHAADLAFSDLPKGTYQITVSGLKDYSGNELDSATFSVEIRDLTPPNPSKWSARIYQSGTSNQMIKIKFDEPMAVTGPNSVLLTDKYIINGTPLDRLDKSLLRIESADQGSSVVIYYPGKVVTNGMDFTYSSTSKVDIGRVADVDGNYIPTFSTSIKIENQGYIQVVSVAQIDRNKVEILLSDTISHVDQTDFIMYGPNRLYQFVETQLVHKNNQSAIVLTLNQNIDENIQATLLRIVGTKTRNEFGETFNPWGSEYKLVDKMPPYVLRTTIEGVMGDSVIYTKSTGVAEIRFSESIDSRTLSLLSFTIGDYKINNIQVSGNIVRIYVDSVDKDKVSIYDTIIQRVEVRDLAGNGVKDLVLSFTKIYP